MGFNFTVNYKPKVTKRRAYRFIPFHNRKLCAVNQIKVDSKSQTIFLCQWIEKNLSDKSEMLSKNE